MDNNSELNLLEREILSYGRQNEDVCLFKLQERKVERSEPAFLSLFYEES